MERTSEFVKICVLFDTGVNKPRAHRPLSQDARIAQNISDQLRQQDLFLRDLGDLVSNKSIIGDDPTSRIATLTDALKKELSGIQTNIQAFEQAIQSKRGRHQHNHQAHYTIICSSLKSRCAKSAKKFQEALQKHTESIRERSTRRSKFSHGGGNPIVHINTPLFSRTSTATRPTAMSPPHGKHSMNKINQPPTPGMSLSSSQNSSHLQNGGNVPPTSEPQSGPGGLRRRGGNFAASAFMNHQPGGVQQQQTIQQYYHPRDAQTRYQNATQVESTIVEISGMFTRMATMVAEQGEIISRIDDDMDVAQTNVEGAQAELLKYYNMVSGNRGLIIKIFLVLILVIFLFVVVF